MEERTQQDSSHEPTPSRKKLRHLNEKQNQINSDTGQTFGTLSKQPTERSSKNVSV